MKTTLLDRAIAHFDPVRAAARARARVQLHAMNALSGYTSTDGADPFMRRWSVSPRDAAADTLRQLPTQRAQSRALVRNNPLAASAVNTNVVRVVGTGLAMSAQPHRGILGWSEDQAEEWRARVHAEFSLWADSADCDITGRQTFYDKQDLTLRAVLESGDCFTLLPDGEPSRAMPYRLRLQTLEADRIGNPGGNQDKDGIAGGIRHTAAGRPEAAHVYHHHPGTLQLLGGGARYAGDWVTFVGPSGRRRLLHHFKQLRPDQPRGVPYLAPVMGLFKLLGDYTDAEVKAAVVSAFLTVFIESDAGTGPAPVFGVADPLAGQAPGPGQATPGGPGRDEIGLGPAAVIGLAKGERANAVTPGRPNPQFGDFVGAVLDQLGAGLFIGREMIEHKYNTAYTAARAAFLDAWKHLLDMRTLVARSFCQPVAEVWMAEAVALGRIRAPGFFRDPLLRWAYTRFAWQGDSQGSINPRDEVSAYLAAVDGRLMSRERAEWELFGTDWRDTYATKLAEHRRLAADGMLPVPKAGAPAPPPGSTGEGGGQGAGGERRGDQGNEGDQDGLEGALP